jgi:enediyne biosynthesis protein E4
MRELVPTTSFRSHDPLGLHFGLGDADRVDEIVVRWPSGIVQRLGAQRARQRITITESGR